MFFLTTFSHLRRADNMSSPQFCYIAWKEHAKNSIKSDVLQKFFLVFKFVIKMHAASSAFRPKIRM